ncbi:hypothetical protein [Pseudomonas syringae]|uniref:hypothetical protein n=1 Tax=Pseudomonas syringae TaxID=317 RepID=UPI003F772F36
MQLIKLFKTASPEANVLAIGSTLTLLLKILVMNRLPAFFNGAYELGLIAEAVLASVIASYMFYIVVVHMKEQSDRAILQPYVEKHAARIIGDCSIQIDSIKNASGISLSLGSLIGSDLKIALSKIAPYSDAPLLISLPDQYANWFQYFNHYKERSAVSTRKLLDQLPFLDAKMVSLITLIDDCTLFSILPNLQNYKIKNTDLSLLAGSFEEYSKYCQDLNAHLMKLGYASAL